MFAHALDVVYGQVDAFLNMIFFFLLTQINKLDKAVAAANTFYVANPDHMEMRQNLEYYSLMAGVQDVDFKDLEARPHMVRSKCYG